MRFVLTFTDLFISDLSLFTSHFNILERLDACLGYILINESLKLTLDCFHRTSSSVPLSPFSYLIEKGENDISLSVKTEEYKLF